MKSLQLVALCATLFSPALALAQEPAPAPTPAVQQTAAPAPTPVSKPAEKPKRICKGEDLTGSRVAKTKVCRTREEWDEIARRSREQTESMVRQALDGRGASGN